MRDHQNKALKLKIHKMGKQYAYYQYE
jgi:hypothetical protein